MLYGNLKFGYEKKGSKSVIKSRCPAGNNNVGQGHNPPRCTAVESLENVALFGKYIQNIED